MLRLAAVALAVLFAVPAWAQAAWPTKPVRIVVPYPGGGGIDILGRVLAERLSPKWGQPVLVDCRPGANTIIGTEAVKNSDDGHTLLLTTDATFTINPHLYGDKLVYDPIKDFQPIILTVYFSQMMVALPSFPASTVAGKLT